VVLAAHWCSAVVKEVVYVHWSRPQVQQEEAWAFVVEFLDLEA